MKETTQDAQEILNSCSDFDVNMESTNEAISDILARQKHKEVIKEW